MSSMSMIILYTTLIATGHVAYPITGTAGGPPPSGIARVTMEVQPEPVEEPASKNLHAGFAGILRRHVRDERVDYLLIRRDEMTNLAAYLDSLAKTDLENLEYAPRLAYYINLYNATMIQTVAQRLVSGYSVSADNWSVFDEPLVRIGTRRISLNDLEHKIIRPEFKDPRIHAALVCAAISCPPLSDRAYTADVLDSMLNDAMRSWLNDPSRNRVDRRKKMLALSSIFDWYADDFGGKSGVDAYVNDWIDGLDVKNWDVTFLKYDWTLNMARPIEGTWMEVTTSGASLHSGPDESDRKETITSGSILEVLEERGDRVRVRAGSGTGATEGWVSKRSLRAFEG